MSSVFDRPPFFNTLFVFFIPVLLAALLLNSPAATAAELTLNKLDVYATPEIPALHTKGYYTPFKTLRQGAEEPDGEKQDGETVETASETFLLVLADFGIAWDEPGTPGHPGSEEVTYTLADIALVDADGARLQPVGAITPDLRARFTGNLEFQKFTARQQWWHENLRVGAVFHAPADGDYTLEIGKDRFSIAGISHDLPDPAALLDIKVTATTMIDTLTANEAYQGRVLPDTTVTITNPQGKLLKVALDLTPQGANVEGGDLRYSFWTQDFMINAEGAYFPVIGYIENERFSEPGQINITPQGDLALGESPTAMTLVFAVPDTFIGGSLSFLGRPKSDISLTKLPPGQ